MNLRKVRILDSTFITPIQMEGPVVTPLPLTTPVIFDLVRRGYQVVENVDGQDVRLTLVNVKDPRKYLNNNVTNVTPSQQPVRERQFANRAEIAPTRSRPVATEVVEEEPVETPSEPEETFYGEEVQMVDTSINMPESTSGILYNGRTETPEVSEEVESVESEDIGATLQEQSENSNQNNYNNNNHNGNNKNRNKNRRR